MIPQPPIMAFTCDDCLFVHTFARDYGKSLEIKDEEGHDCTGYLCRNCAYGYRTRAERRAAGKSACVTKCHRQPNEGEANG